MAVPDREPPRAFLRHAGAPARRPHRHDGGAVGDRRRGHGPGGWPLLVGAIVAVIGIAIGASRLATAPAARAVGLLRRWYLQLVLAAAALLSGGPRSRSPACSPSPCSWWPRASATAGWWWGRRSARCSCSPPRSASTRPTSSTTPSRSMVPLRSCLRRGLRQPARRLRRPPSRRQHARPAHRPAQPPRARAALRRDRRAGRADRPAGQRRAGRPRPLQVDQRRPRPRRRRRRAARRRLRPAPHACARFELLYRLGGEEFALLLPGADGGATRRGSPRRCAPRSRSSRPPACR